MSIYEIKVVTNKGEEVTLEQYKGKVLLIVNTAIKCGLTPQYDALEELYEKYHDQGFEILDFPCNQFLGQAPGSDEKINEFCTLKFNIKFPRFTKIKVNGRGAHPLFVYLKNAIEGKKGSIKWNFTKFLISKEGEVLDRFQPMTKPMEFEEAIKEALAK